MNPAGQSCMLSSKSRKTTEQSALVKFDLRMQLSQFYNPPVNQVEIVEIPAMNFLMLDGEGNPNTSPEYKESIEILYGLSYWLKFALRKERQVDYQVMPLEGLWHVEEPGMHKPKEWTWTSMIMQPEFVTDDMVEKAVDAVEMKKKLACLGRIRFETFSEGLSAQIMHIGPYSAEEATIRRLHDYISGNGLQMRGQHHEIYMGDPRRASPSKLRTIIRQPVFSS